MAFDEELLAMVPPAAVAVLMLFPLTAALEAAVLARDSSEKPTFEVPSNLFFMEQLVGNACGTIGLLHAVINNQMSAVGVPRVRLADGGFIRKFMDQIACKGSALSPLEIGTLLANSDDLDGLHSLAAERGQSGLPDESKEEDDPHNRIYHFVAFVEKDGYLWELDGRRAYPHRWGPCDGSSGAPLLKAAAPAIEWFMQQDAENIQFGLTALVATGE